MADLGTVNRKIRARRARRLMDLKAIRKLVAIREKLLRRPATISPAGVQFITAFEGFSATPTDKLDGFSTVGYGHLIAHRPVTAADRKATWVRGQTTPGRLTEPEARRLLADDLARTYEPAVLRLFQPGGPLAGKWSQPRYDALVSFVYNLGVASLSGISGFETIGAAVRRSHLQGIADAMPLYNRGPSGPLPGLIRRRRAERRLFLTGSYSTT